MHDPTTAAQLGALERGVTWAVVQIAGVGAELHPRLQNRVLTTRERNVGLC